LRDFWIPAFHEVITSERRNDAAGDGEFTLSH